MMRDATRLRMARSLPEGLREIQKLCYVPGERQADLATSRRPKLRSRFFDYLKFDGCFLLPGSSPRARLFQAAPRKDPPHDEVLCPEQRLG